jgi:hypothetical protein
MFVEVMIDTRVRPNLFVFGKQVLIYEELSYRPTVFPSMFPHVVFHNPISKWEL